VTSAAISGRYGLLRRSRGRREARPGDAVLRRALAGQRWHLTRAVAFLGTHQAGEALVPVVIGVVIDEAVAGGSVGDLVRWLVVLGLVFAGLSSGYRLGARAAERAAEQAAHELRVAVTARVLDARGGAGLAYLPGELANVATSDAKRVGAVGGSAPFGIAAVVALLVGGVALLRMSVPLGVLALAGAPLLLGLVGLLGRPLEHRSEAEQEHAAEASGVAADLVAGIRILKGIGAEDAAIARYRETSRRSLAATLRAAGAGAAYEGSVQALSRAFLAVVAFFGAWLALRGELTVGQLVAAVGLAQFLLGPLSVFGWVRGEVAQGRASAGRVAAVLDAPVAVPAGSDPGPGSGAGSNGSTVRGELRLAGVRLGGLRGLDLHVAPGEVVGVVCADPADAAALLDCLGREAEPDDGKVELDGVPVAAVEPAALRALVLVAAHDADLFSGTLEENVTAAAAGPDAVERAIAASRTDDVVASLPDGRATVLAERGRSVSGGQRQRIALARALAADAPVLVLHEPTTAVDAATEARIAEGLRELRRDRTTVLVTTSPALLAVTGRAVLVAAGRVTAEGSHAELLRDDAYRAAVLA
jgi:putative ABC transport system ATP-binding protein